MLFIPLENKPRSKYSVMLTLYLHQDIFTISVDADSPLLNFLRTVSLAVIETGIYGIGVGSCHLPEWILDDHRGIGSDADFQIQYVQILVSVQKI